MLIEQFFSGFVQNNAVKIVKATKRKQQPVSTLTFIEKRLPKGDPSTVNQSPREKKLKKDIIQLRKKSKENLIKIKCLQNKIRRILRKKMKSKGQTVKTEQGLKRKKLFADDDSTDSESLPPSPSTSVIDKIDFGSETDIKHEPDDESLDIAPYAPAEMNNSLVDVKTIEDDPLQICND